MSSVVMAWCFDNAPEDLKPPERLVLLAIADEANSDGGNAWPSLARLSRRTGLTADTVSAVITRLEAAQLVWKEKNAGGPPEMRGDRRPNRYTVLMGRSRADLADPHGGARDGGASGRPPSARGPVAGSHGAPSGARTGGRDTPDNPSTDPTAEPNPPTAPLRGAAPSRGSRLPADWTPSSELIAWTREAGLPIPRIRVVLETFRDHWASAPGSRGVKLDWDATWRNWVRRDLERRPRVEDDVFALVDSIVAAQHTDLPLALDGPS